jgi:hypothetical protein
MIWHHRRNSLRAYWKQQVGYGKAEGLLERKWPEKYNAAGHVTWAGRVYGNGHTHRLGRSWRVYHGIWGSAPFQPRDERSPRLLCCLPLLPEWYLVILVLGCISALGTVWSPLLWGLPLLIVAAAAPVAQAVLSGARASFSTAAHFRAIRVWLSALTAFLHLLQPLARLWGRLCCDLTPWRKRGVSGIALPRLRTFRLWSECWQDAADRLRSLEASLGRSGVSVTRGGEYDAWDLEARDGTFGAVKLLMTIEEHGAGRQLVRVRAWPIVSPGLLALIFALFGIALAAALQHAWLPSGSVATMDLLVFARVFHDCSTATAATMRALEQLGAEESL